MNDQRPHLRIGDRVTLHDPQHYDHPQTLLIVNLHWCPHEGDWFATAADPENTRSVFRRAHWFTRGWPA